MARGERRKCPCCRKLFRPEARNRHHQRYCSKPDCRAASKASSQARWLAKPDNQDYFRGPVNVARNRAWRSRHPRYWREGAAQQDLLLAQPIGSTEETAKVAQTRQQDLLLAQPAVLIGLIAHITGAPQQDLISGVIDRLLRLGQDILATSAIGDNRV